MPVLKHAKKKLRQDVRRTRENKKVRDTFKRLLKKAKAAPSKEAVRLAVQAVDKAAKEHVIHKNKAARLKSSLAKANEDTTTATKTSPAKKSATKKTSTKKTTAKKTSAKK